MIEAGIHLNMPTDVYFADPCKAPSLSQSIAKVLIEQSPAHARMEHPRLRPPPFSDDEPAEKYEPAKAIGNAAHAMMIGRGKDICEAKFDNWMKGDAKKFRDDPEHEGKIVILSKHLRRAAAMVNAARASLDLMDWLDAFEERGNGEVVIAWEESGIWFRSLIDWKVSAAPVCYDLKTSGMSVAPHSIGMMIESAGWHIQAAMHERGLDILEPRDAGRRKFRFLAQENYPPYAVTPVELDEHWMTLGRKKLQFAVDIWRRCIEADHWPAYPLVPMVPDYPGFRETQWLAREIEHEQSNATTGFLGPDHLMAG